MNAPTKLQIEAERVYALTSSPMFQDTVGKWLSDIKDTAVREMAFEDDQIKSAKARGRYLAVTEILDRIEAVMRRRDAEALRNAKKLKGE